MKKMSHVKKEGVIVELSDSERIFLPCIASFLRRFLLTGLLLCFFIPSISRGEGVTLREDDSVGSFPSRFFDDPSLDETVSRLVSTLVEQGQLKGRLVLISPHDLYDAKTGLSLPLAMVLRGKLITEMKKEGVRVLLPGADEERTMILQGSWQREGEYLAIDLKVMKIGLYGPEAVASASQKVRMGRIDADALTPDRESWARYLVRKLEQNTANPGIRKVYMSDFKVKSKKISPRLGSYLAGWLRPALAQGRMFVLLDQQKGLKALSAKTLRTRGTRAIRPDSPEPGAGISLTADLLKADGEIKGVAWLHEKKVEVRIRVIDRQGRQITAASADIPSALFPEELLRPEVPGPGPGPFGVEPDKKGISKGGLKVELTTTRGDRRPRYANGEQIRFVIRLNRSAWVYLFDFDPAGKATLLYPVDENGRLAHDGQCGSLPLPGIPLILPEDGCSYDLVVMAPYGRDRVRVVASESKLPFPKTLSGKWKNADFLVEKLREHGFSQEGGYAESEVEVVTGPSLVLEKGK
jgi:hypothetical protein